MPKQTLQQFGQSIKAKHPEYKDMDDAALAQAVLAKYPQYQDLIVPQEGGVQPGVTITGQNSVGKNVYGSQDAATPSYWEALTNPVGAGGQKQGIGGGALQVGGQAIKTMAQPFIHPIDTIKSLGQVAAGLTDPRAPDALIRPIVENYAADKANGGHALALENLGGMALGTVEGGRLIGGAADATKGAGTAIRTAAIGNPDVAALRGLRVPSGSPKALSTVRAVQGARPFLQGAESLEDLQAKVPAAKSEIWGPYQKTVDAISDRPVHGPDGPTTVGELEKERVQLSALNRELKSRAPNPEAVQLAQQKGLNQAQLLAREKEVQSALDPELQSAGIDPKLIRQNFGQVAQVGERISGKSTLAEPQQPFGFAKLKDVSLTKPLSNIPLAGDVVRDIAAGRYFSAKPTDVALREAFRMAGPKPDFRAPASAIPPFENAPRLLEANVPGNAPFGDEPYAGSTNGMPERNPVRVTPAPNVRGLLPEAASEPNYMRRYIEPEPQGIRTPPPVPPRGLLPSETAPSETQPYIAYRPAPPAGERFGVVPSRYARLQMQGEPLPSSGGIKGLLPAPEVPAPSPAPTAAHIYPAGSAFRDLPPDTPFYPPASQFRPRIAPFDVDEYLRNQTKPLVPPQGTQ